jgi:hypothetical protein
MGALSEMVGREWGGSYLVSLNDEPVAASTKVYSGGALGFSDGLVLPISGASYPFAGFAEADVDNSAGGAAAKYVGVRRQGVVKLIVAGATTRALSIDKTVYATADDTFTLTATSATPIGKVVAWESSTVVWVFFRASTLGQLFLPAAASDTITDSTGGTPGTTLAAQTLPDVITDSTGGVAATTLPAITAGAEYAQADMAAAKVGLASMAAQHAKVLAQLTAARNALASLAKEHNDLLAVLRTAGIIAT